MFKIQKYSNSKKKKTSSVAHKGQKAGVSSQDVVSLGVIKSMPQQAEVDRHIILIDPPVSLYPSLLCHHLHINDAAQCNELLALG